MAISRSGAKCLKSTCEIVFILYILLKILRLVHETNSFTEVFCKKDVLKKKSENLHVNTKNSHPKMFCQKGFLKIFAKFIGKHLRSSLFLVKFQIFSPADLKKEAPAQMFFCELCEISKNTYFVKHLREAASKRPVPESLFKKSATLTT